jgi:hypothetical protein
VIERPKPYASPAIGYGRHSSEHRWGGGLLEGHDSIVGDDEICETVRSDKFGDRAVEILFGDLTGPSTGKSGV